MTSSQIAPTQNIALNLRDVGLPATLETLHFDTVLPTSLPDDASTYLEALLERSSSLRYAAVYGKDFVWTRERR